MLIVRYHHDTLEVSTDDNEKSFLKYRGLKRLKLIEIIFRNIDSEE